MTAIFDETIHEVGTVRTAGDGIVSIDGLDHAMYGEVVQFDNGEKGMVQDNPKGYDPLHPWQRPRHRGRQSGHPHEKTGRHSCGRSLSRQSG